MNNHATYSLLAKLHERAEEWVKFLPPAHVIIFEKRNGNPAEEVIYESGIDDAAADAQNNNDVDGNTNNQAQQEGEEEIAVDGRNITDEDGHGNNQADQENGGGNAMNVEQNLQANQEDGSEIAADGQGNNGMNENANNATQQGGGGDEVLTREDLIVFTSSNRRCSPIMIDRVLSLLQNNTTFAFGSNIYNHLNKEDGTTLDSARGLLDSHNRITLATNASVLLMPVQEGDHWALLVMEKEKRVAHFLDSRSSVAEVIIRWRDLWTIMDWMNHIAEDIGSAKGWRIECNIHTSPQQEMDNNYLGGAYVCMNGICSNRIVYT